MNEVRISGAYTCPVAVSTDEGGIRKFRLSGSGFTATVVAPEGMEMPEVAPGDVLCVVGTLETTPNNTYILATSVAHQTADSITGPLDLTKVAQANEGGHRLLWQQINKLKGKIGRIDYDHVAGCIENMRERLETLERNGAEQHKTAERLLGRTDMLIERADKAADNIENLWEKLGEWAENVAKTTTAVENAQATADQAHDRLVTVEKRQDQVVEQQDILRNRHATLEVNVVDHEKALGQLLDDHKALARLVEIEIGAVTLLHDCLKGMGANLTHMGRIFMSEIMAKSDD